MNNIIKNDLRPLMTKSGFGSKLFFVLMVINCISIACAELASPLPINIPQGQDYQFKSILQDKDWIWRMRVTEFNMTTSMGEEEIGHRLEVVKKLGYNTIIIWGEHYRFCAVSRWSAIEQEVATITRLAHEAGLRAIEHHSALATAQANLNDQWNGTPLSAMTNINAQTGTYDFFGGTSLFLCPNNTLWQAAYASHVRALLQGGIDGLMSDDVEMCNSAYVCACTYCREKFKKETGLVLPSADDNSFWMNWDNPNFRKWIRFRQVSCGEHHVRMRQLINEINPGVKLLACHCQPTGTWLNVWWAASIEEFAKYMDILFLEAQNYGGYFSDWPRQSADMMYLRSLGKDKSQPVFPLSYLAGRKTYEVLFGSNEAAAKFRPSGLTYEGVLSGKLENTAGLNEQYFVWDLDMMFAHRFWLNMGDENIIKPYCFEDKYINTLYVKPESIAKIGIVYSRQTRDYYGGLDTGKFVDEWLGWCTAALVNNIPYEVVKDEDLEQGLSSRYSAIVLPNVACLSAKQVSNLRSFVKQGGRIIAIGETSLYDENGKKLDDFQLADMYGLSYSKKLKDVANDKVKYNNDSSIASSINGIAKSDIIEIREKSRKVEGSIPFQVEGASAGYVKNCNSYGKGISLYIPVKAGLLGRLQSPSRLQLDDKKIEETVTWKGFVSPYFGDLLKDALLWGTNSKPQLKVNGHDGIIATIQKVEDRHIIQMLNGTSVANKKVGDKYNPNWVEFPRIGAVSIELDGIKAESIVYLSPDIEGEIKIQPVRDGGKVMIKVPEEFQKYGVLVIQ